MILNSKCLKLMIMLAIILPIDTFPQTRQEVGIVSEVNGTCWLCSPGTGKKMQIKRSMTFSPGDTLITGIDGKLKIFLWSGDQKKTLFSNNIFVVPAIESSKRKQSGILGAAFNLFKEKYTELTNVVAEPKSQEAAIRGLPIEQSSMKGKSHDISNAELFLLFPRNENVYKNELKFYWVSMGEGTLYKFRLKENEKFFIEKETTDNELTLNLTFNPRVTYVWYIKGIDSKGKVFNDSAYFKVLTEIEETMIEKEIASFIKSGESLSAGQKMLIRPMIYDKWNMFTRSLKEYGNLLMQPTVEMDEIVSFIKIEYKKMGFPDDERCLRDYVQWQKIRFEK